MFKREKKYKEILIYMFYQQQLGETGSTQFMLLLLVAIVSNYSKKVTK